VPEIIRDVLTKKDRADILFRKYALLKTEIHLQIGHFKKHVRNFQLIMSPTLAAVSYLLINPQYAPTDMNKWVWIASLFVLVTATCYLIYDNLDASYQILVLAERLAMIERIINGLAGQTLLIWESKLSEHLNTRRPFTVIHPIWILRYYGIALLASLLLVIPCAASYSLWHVALTHSRRAHIAIVILIFYSAGSAILAFVVAKGVEKNARSAARSAIDNL
jgi:hypothetical protein